MRQVSIARVAARTASGRYTQPEYKVWVAREYGNTIAFDSEKAGLEKMFPHAHNEYDHHYDHHNGCTAKGCWRNPNTREARSHGS